MSWRTFICRLKCRFAAATRDQVIRRQADAWYRKLGPFPGLPRQAGGNISANTGIPCTAALFVVRYLPPGAARYGSTPCGRIVCSVKRFQSNQHCGKLFQEQRRKRWLPIGAEMTPANGATLSDEHRGIARSEIAREATISWKAVRARSVNVSAGRYPARPRSPLFQQITMLRRLKR